MIRLCEARGVTVHFASENIDYSTASGRFTLHSFGAGAEFQSRYISERVRESVAARRAQGRPVGRITPRGVKLAGRDG